MSNPALSAESAFAQKSGQTKGAPPTWVIWLAGVAIALAGWAVYSKSLGGPFIFDDGPNILENRSIQHSWWEALHPPAGTGQTVAGRPVVNLSLALNYELGGFNVWGYHLFNLVIQLLAGLTLFGLVRRTLERPALQPRFGEAALPLAFVVALLWTVHPLQTESVTYIVQRAEAMMGLFYLLTLYCFVRSVESSRAWVWRILSVIACLLGMLTKETMVTAPLMAWLYDRTFVAGTFAHAWRQRWKFYATLACTWLPLAWIVVNVSMPGNSSVKNPGLDGLSLGMKSYFYGLKQCEAVVRYLGLSFWPHPLVFNYGKDVVTNLPAVAPQIVVVALLVGGAFYALWRQPVSGFLGTWFFVILAPTSSVVPLNGQTMAEHHMYLSLAAVMVFVVLGLHALLGRRIYLTGLALALGLGGLTFQRDNDYRTDFSIWADTLRERPDNPANYNNLGRALEDTGRRQEALPWYETAVRMSPADPQMENNLGDDLGALGRPAEALPYLLQSVELNPAAALPYYNLGNTYHMLNKPDEARDAYLMALRINPYYADAHNNLANLYLLDFNRVDLAIAEYKAALQANPEHVWAQGGLAKAYLQTHQWSEAIPHLETAIRLKPDFGEAYLGLGDALLALDRAAEALGPYETAVRLLPDQANAHFHLGAALGKLNRVDEAVREFEETLRLDPNYPNAQAVLEQARRIPRSPSGPASAPPEKQ